MAGTQGTGSGMHMNDAEILASVIAVDLNEVLAAAEAGKKKISQPVLAYAKLLHEEHGMNMVQTMKLGQQIARLSFAGISRSRGSSSSATASSGPCRASRQRVLIHDHRQVASVRPRSRRANSTQ